MKVKTSTYGSLTFFLPLIIAASLVIAGCARSTGERVSERNKQLVLQMNDVIWNKGDLDRLAEFFSPDIVRHFLPDGSELKGIDRLQEDERVHFAAFPDWKEEIKHAVAEDDLVVIHFVSTGTNKGTWLGKPATGRKIRINEMSIFRVENGKIVEQWLMPDMLSMQQQLAPPDED